MGTQFITDDQGKKISVVIPMAEYEKMMEELEEIHDIKLYDDVKSRNENSLPLEEYLKGRKRALNHG